jgi:glycosyltransferase involved in cell wall biosynthesis
MKKIAILLNSPIQNDSRVVKIIQTLSEKNLVFFFYVNGNIDEDKSLFNENVHLYNFIQKTTFWTKVKRNTLFCYEFMFFYDKVIKSGVQYDAVWCNDLPTLIPATKISKKLKCKLIYDSHEIYTETLNQFFPRKARGIKKIIYSILLHVMKRHGETVEKKYIPKVDVFITVNESLLSYFSNKQVIKRGLVIMNLPKIKDKVVNEKIDFKQKFGWSENSFISIYQGVLNEGRGLKTLLQAYVLLEESFKLVFLGNGPIQHELMEYVQINSLEHRVKFINLVPLNAVNKYTAGANLGINLLESYNLSKTLASPNKLFEYIHEGIPVLASYSLENIKVFNSYNIGYLTKNNPIAIADNLNRISKQEKSTFEEALNLAKEYYNWENQLPVFNLILEI